MRSGSDSYSYICNNCRGDWWGVGPERSGGCCGDSGGENKRNVLAAGGNFDVGPLIKAAQLELKAGTPERKIVGLMAARFSKSESQIRRVLKEKGVLK